MNNTLSISELIHIHKIATDIIEFESISWKEKFELIFSDAISAKVKLTWHDPDEDYKDDVMAFMRAFDEEMEQLKNTLWQ